MQTTLKRFVAVRKKLQRERLDLVSRVRQIDIILSRISSLVEPEKKTQPVKAPNVSAQAAAH